MRQQALQFRGKGKRAVRQQRGKQRLHAEPVAGEEQLAALAIVQREGEHAVETGEAVGAPLPPRGKDHLGIAFGPEGMTQPGQLAAQRAIIVDLTVEHDCRASIRRMHRLRRSLYVDHRQAAVRQPYAIIAPQPRPIRPTVNHPVAHPHQQIAVNLGMRLPREQTGDPAHATRPSGSGCAGPARQGHRRR